MTSAGGGRAAYWRAGGIGLAGKDDLVGDHHSVDLGGSVLVATVATRRNTSANWGIERHAQPDIIAYAAWQRLRATAVVVVQPSSPLDANTGDHPTPCPPATFRPRREWRLCSVLDRLRTRALPSERRKQPMLSLVSACARCCAQTVTPRSAQCSDPRALITAPLPDQTLRGSDARLWDSRTCNVSLLY